MVHYICSITYIAPSGHKLYFYFYPKALSFQDVAIGLRYNWFTAIRSCIYQKKIYWYDGWAVMPSNKTDSLIILLPELNRER